MNTLITRILRKVAGKVPASNLRLRLLHLIHLRLEEPEPELKYIERLLPTQRRCAVDVGANCGHYSIEFCKYFDSVIAFEINETLTRELQHFSEKLRVVPSGLSSSSGTATLYIPLMNGSLPLHGWASLETSNCPYTDVYAEKSVSIETLDSYHLADVDFIKIDVEGHELEVLRGARRTLQDCSPVVLIEVKEANLEAVTDFLKGIGYVNRSLDRIFPATSKENFFFVKRSDQEETR
jgi:FkbM family methyltransferase